MIDCFLFELESSKVISKFFICFSFKDKALFVNFPIFKV